MSITREAPNTIWLGGPGTVENTRLASAAITPGMLIELHTDGKIRPHGTGGGGGQRMWALDQSMLNKGIDDAYAADDLVEAVITQPGGTIYALIPSGQNITVGNELESAGTGKLVIKSSGVAFAKALESVNATSGDARIRVESL